MRVVLFVLLFTITCSNAAKQNFPDKSFLETIKIDGIKREYILYVPEKRQSKPALVIALHGRRGSGFEFMKTSHLNEVAEQEGWILAYPSGIDNKWNDGRYTGKKDENDDVSFLVILRDTLINRFGADEKQVFLVGYSNGGFMAQRLLLEKSDKFKAGVSVASSLSKLLVDKNKAPKNPVSVMFLFGTKDPVVPYEGGNILGNDPVLGMEETIEKWKSWNVCNDDPDVSFTDAMDDNTSVDSIIYPDCASGKRIKYLRIKNGGHGWPDPRTNVNESYFGTTSKEIVTAEEIRRFFREVSESEIPGFSREVPRKN